MGEKRNRMQAIRFLHSKRQLGLALRLWQSVIAIKRQRVTLLHTARNIGLVKLVLNLIFSHILSNLFL